MTRVEQEAGEKTAQSEPENSSQVSVRIGAASILLLILLSLVWYLLGDRYTPYTQQARILGYVIGVSPEVSGVVTKVMVQNDQRVTRGQVLFELDSSQYEIALQRAQSDLENTKTQIAAGSAGIESAQAKLLAAKANATKAKQDADRQERLYKEDKGAISVRRLEMARASFAQAQAKVASAEAEVQRAIEQKGGEGEKNAKLKAALTAVEKAKLDLEHTVVKASSNGVITDLRADVGQFAAAGAPVMTLIAIQDIWVRAEFTENNLGNIKVGTPVELVVDALPGQVFRGTVRSIGLGVSTGQAPPPGSLPTIDNNRDWLRQSQRFPVSIGFDAGQREMLEGYVRIGGQVEVIAYTEPAHFLKTLGKIYIRFMSWFSYAY